MATQVEATASAPGAIEQLQRLIERFGVIVAALAAIAASLATLWKETLPQIQWAVGAIAAVTRFGPGGRRPEMQIADPITDEIEETRNPFLEGARRPGQGPGRRPGM